MRGLLALLFGSLLAAGVADAAQAPTRAELAARAKALGFEVQAKAIARDALRGARLVAGGNGAVGESRLGGSPDLPPGMKWPRCKGRPLSFLAQLRLADIARVAPHTLPSRGTLVFFADLNPNSQGVPPVEEAADRVGEATCVIVRQLRGALARRPVPHRVERLRNRPLRLKPTLTVPDYDIAQERYKLGDERKLENQWYELFAEAINGRLHHIPADADYPVVHQVLGWPRPVQYSAVDGCGQDTSRLAYRLLLQLDYDTSLRFDIGDGGSLYITGKPADLRAGRWSRLCAEFQEG